jgi:hypothetical protein
LRGRRIFPVIAVVVVGIAAAVGLFNSGWAGGVEPVNHDATRLALRGYDAVAYFREGRAAEGSAEFTHEWNGARWLFKSAENRDAFARAPVAFAPQYGGYCSYAVSRGYTADGDPHAWKVVGGKLYLNYNVDVRGLWEQDVTGNIQRGDANWPRFLRHKPEHKG